MCDPTTMVSAFADAWNRHDMNALADLFETDARFVNVVGMFWRSREQIQAAHLHTHESIFRDSVLAVNAVESTRLDDGLVAMHAHWTLCGHLGPSGDREAPRNGVLLLVARRAEENGTWSIAIAQNTDAIPGVSTIPQ